MDRNLRRTPAVGPRTTGITTSLALACAVVVASCASPPTTRAALPAAVHATSSNQTPTTRRLTPHGPVLLVRTPTGVAGVVAGSSTAVWSRPNAAAALDGSAVAAIQSTGSGAHLIRLAPKTGRPISTQPIPIGLHVVTIAPQAEWIALTDRRTTYGPDAGRRATTIVVAHGANTALLIRKIAGDIEPEAFSTDGSLLFALAHHGTTYNVIIIELATGTIQQVLDRTKKPPSEATMQGLPVRAVLSSDRSIVATLYRDPTNTAHPAFVHMLKLAGPNFSYCADLPSPFGTGPSGSDRIALSDHGSVLVEARVQHRVADIDLAGMTDFSTTPIAIDFRDGSVTSPEVELRAYPDFRQFIAPAK